MRVACGAMWVRVACGGEQCGGVWDFSGGPVPACCCRCCCRRCRSYCKKVHAAGYASRPPLVPPGLLPPSSFCPCPHRAGQQRVLRGHADALTHQKLLLPGEGPVSNSS